MRPHPSAPRSYSSNGRSRVAICTANTNRRRGEPSRAKAMPRSWLLNEPSPATTPASWNPRVEATGIEPATSCMPCKRSTN